MAQRSWKFLVAMGAGVGFLACQQGTTFAPVGDEGRYSVIAGAPAPTEVVPTHDGLLVGRPIPIPPNVERIPQPPRSEYVCPAPIVLYLNFSGGPIQGGNCDNGVQGTPCSFIVSNGATS